MASRQGRRSRGHHASAPEPLLTQEGLADILSSATLCVQLDPKGEPTVYQYGYLVAPHLVVTVWHQLFAQHVLHAAQLPSEKPLPDIWIRTAGFPTSNARRSALAGVSEIIAANSQADCVLLRLEHALRTESLSLGSFVQPQKGWERAQTYLRLQGSDSSSMGSLRAGALGRFVDVQPELSQPLHEFSLEQTVESSQSYDRGAPIISEITGLCLGHITGSRASMNAFWVCPASTISQLNPDLLRIWDASPQQKNTEYLWRLKLSPPAHVQILTSVSQDKLDIMQALELAGFTSQKPPLFQVDVQQVEPRQRGAKLPLDDNADIVVVLLDEVICKYGDVLKQGRFDPSHSHAPEALLACIVADRIDASAAPLMRASTIHLSVERPLRWIFDRSRRLCAWMQIFNRLQLLILRANILQIRPS